MKLGETDAHYDPQVFCGPTLTRTHLAKPSRPDGSIPNEGARLRGSEADFENKALRRQRNLSGITGLQTDTQTNTQTKTQTKDQLYSKRNDIQDKVSSMMLQKDIA